MLRKDKSRLDWNSSNCHQFHPPHHRKTDGRKNKRSVLCPPYFLLPLYLTAERSIYPNDKSKKGTITSFYTSCKRNTRKAEQLRNYPISHLKSSYSFRINSLSIITMKYLNLHSHFVHAILLARRILQNEV